MSTIVYAPSEASIEAAIESRIGSAGFFQKVAEQLARSIYVDLADDLVPYGRNPNEKTVQGWPDAYLKCPDGSLIAVEATTAAKPQTGHWPGDLAKLQEPLVRERIGGLVWVAWDGPSTPTTEATMRQEAIRLGLRPEDVHIVFRKELCARLSAPFHAPFWIKELGLRASALPFESVRDRISRGATRLSSSIFPTMEEYEQGSVYAPPILAEIEQAMAEQGSAMVVGHGAAGKTTLAMVLAHLPRFRHRPAFYLDLTSASDDPTLAERASEVIAACSDRGVLFILDNAHLDPSAASLLLRQWEQFGGESNLLILTRRVRALTEVWNDEPEPEALSLPIFDLVIQPEDLAGVYRRLFCARQGDEPPHVDSGILARWHKVFGGDLMTFSAGVSGLLDRQGGPAALVPADASAYVRHHYLENAELTGERSALLDLAAVAEVEGLVPVDAFPRGALAECVRRGIVWIESVSGRAGTYERYRLSHPGLGTLLRDAAGISDTSRQDRHRVLTAQPYACVALATKLKNSGEDAEANALTAALWRNESWPLERVPLPWWPRAIQSAQATIGGADEVARRADTWLVKLGAKAELVKQALATQLHILASFLAYARTNVPELARAVHEGLAQNPDELLKGALATPLLLLASFLAYARTNAPELARAVHEGLAKNPDELLKRALATPLGNLASFLAYARTNAPELARAVHEGLAKNPDELLKRALATPLGYLASFLAYARTNAPELARAVHEGLAKNPDELLKGALATPLGNLASFLAYARTNAPELARVVHEGSAKNPDELLKGALATPLGDLASFLVYARTNAPELARAVHEGLAKNPDELLKRALATPLDHLASFLAYVRTNAPELARAVHERLAKNPDELLKRALATPLGNLASFLAYARTNAPELARAVHEGLAKNPDELLKRALATPLDHLASFLAYARDTMPVAMADLVNAMVSEPFATTLALGFVENGPQKIAALCNQHEAFVRILPNIDAEAWSRRWGGVYHGQPLWFRNFARSCYSANREDLRGITARAIIQTACPEDFPSPASTLLHLTSILTSSHGCTALEVEAFFGEGLPYGWLAAQYRSSEASVGALAGAVRSAGFDEREWLRSFLFHSALLERIQAEAPTIRQSPRQVADWLQLLGAARILNSDAILLPTDNLSLSGVLEVRPPGPPDQPIQPMQAGLWGGLRAWCHLRRQRPFVNASLAEGILAQFRAVNLVDRPRISAFNAVMIRWLMACQSQDWRLVVDDEPLLDALEREIRTHAMTSGVSEGTPSEAPL